MDLVNPAAKLEPFLLMAKSAKGAAAAKLIQDTTSAPGVFVFAELLQLPNIQELASSQQYSSFFSLLQLFSYKTYQDYTQLKESYPPLNPAQIAKLKHLTLASFAMQRRIMPYATLQSALDLPSIRTLEDVIIDAIYLDIIRGKLDQKQQQFQVEWVMGRDLAPGALEDLLGRLQEWSNTTATLLTQLDHTILSVQSSQTAQSVALENYSVLQQKILCEVIQNHSKQGFRNRRGGEGFSGLPAYTQGEDRMEVDEPGIPPWTDSGKKKKVGQEALPKSTRKRNRF